MLPTTLVLLAYYESFPREDLILLKPFLSVWVGIKMDLTGIASVAFSHDFCDRIPDPELDAHLGEDIRFTTTVLYTRHFATKQLTFLSLCQCAL